MFARAASRLVQANKSAIVPKRNYNGVLYQFSPPRNKVSPGVRQILYFCEKQRGCFTNHSNWIGIGCCGCYHHLWCLWTIDVLRLQLPRVQWQSWGPQKPTGISTSLESDEIFLWLIVKWLRIFHVLYRTILLNTVFAFYFKDYSTTYKTKSKLDW